MERVLNTAQKACPFLHNASAATLRNLSTKTSSGATSNKLMNKAQQCPVMGKAMAVQTSRFHTTAKVATPTPTIPRAIASNESKKAGKLSATCPSIVKK
jgi:5-aminolevulinate synthase